MGRDPWDPNLSIRTVGRLWWGVGVLPFTEPFLFFDMLGRSECSWIHPHASCASSNACGAWVGVCGNRGGWIGSGRARRLSNCARGSGISKYVVDNKCKMLFMNMKLDISLVMLGLFISFIICSNFGSFCCVTINYFLCIGNVSSTNWSCTAWCSARERLSATMFVEPLQ